MLNPEKCGTKHFWTSGPCCWKSRRHWIVTTMPFGDWEVLPTNNRPTIRGSRRFTSPSKFCWNLLPGVIARSVCWSYSRTPPEIIRAAGTEWSNLCLLVLAPSRRDRLLQKGRPSHLAGEVAGSPAGGLACQETRLPQ